MRVSNHSRLRPAAISRPTWIHLGNISMRVCVVFGERSPRGTADGLQLFQTTLQGCGPVVFVAFVGPRLWKNHRSSRHYLPLRSCRPGRKSVSGFRQKSEKNGPKMDFGLTGKIGKRSPKKRKNRPKMGFFPIFGRFFLFLGDFFPIFPVRPKSIFGPFFSGFLAEARNRFSPRPGSLANLPSDLGRPKFRPCHHGLRLSSQAIC